MNFCTNCGAERVVGRFCTNCGAPTTSSATPGTAAGSVSDTAERPALARERPAEPNELTAERPAARVSGISPVEPPTAHTGQLPTGSRYPLFADEVDRTADRVSAHHAPRRTASAATVAPDGRGRGGARDDRRHLAAR